MPAPLSKQYVQEPTATQKKVEGLVRAMTSFQLLDKKCKENGLTCIPPTVHPDVENMDEVRTGEILHFCSDTNLEFVVYGGFAYRLLDGAIGEGCRRWSCSLSKNRRILRSGRPGAAIFPVLSGYW